VTITINTTPKQIILQALSQQPRTTKELQQLASTSKKNVHKCIQRLRQQDHPIIFRDMHYHYVANTLILFLENSNAFNKELTIEELADALHTTKEHIEKNLSKLFQYYTIIQLTKNTVKILKS
jgi:biotin operon repressor